MNAASNRRSARLPVQAALAIAVVMFLRVAAMYLLFTQETVARAGFGTLAPLALASIRTMAGGFHLGVALVAAVGLARRSLSLPALTFLFLITVCVMMVRWSGLFLFGAVAIVPAITESVAAVLFGTALLFSRSGPSLAPAPVDA